MARPMPRDPPVTSAVLPANSASIMSFLDASGYQFFHDAALDVGDPHVAAAVKVREERVIQSHQMQHGGVKVVHVHFVLYCLIAKIVRRSNYLPALDAAARHPCGESTRAVIAPFAVL